MRKRFNLDFLSDDDPFEIDDGNRPHLYKHLPTSKGRTVAVGVEDIYDVFIADQPLFYEGDERGPADWLMVGEVPALTLVVPLAPSNEGVAHRCRPVGLYAASMATRVQYREDLRHE